MAKRSLAGQLNDLIDGLLAHPDAGLPTSDPQLVAHVRIAAGLRDLPSPEFRAHLKADLERKTSMSSPRVNPVPEGFHTVTPYLVVQQAAELIDFVKQAFE